MAVWVALMVVTSTTPLSWVDTALLSPPLPAAPQVTTDPSARSAANAPWLENTRDTPMVPFRLAATDPASPPKPFRPHVTTVPSMRKAAKAKLLE